MAGTKPAKTPYFHCGSSIKNCRCIRIRKKKDSNTNIEDSNNNDDNMIEALNSHSGSSICLML